MIATGLPLQCVAIGAPGGYDTHGDQAPDLTQNLKLTADSLYAFQRDLEARGLQDRVLTLVWSEFGRRAEENGSAGTDHGAAGTAFVIGSQVKGGMIGEFPGLGKGSGLDDDGNVRRRRTSAASTGRCSSSGSRSIRAACCPTPPSSRRCRCSGEGAPRCGGGPPRALGREASLRPRSRRACRSWRTSTR